VPYADAAAEQLIIEMVSIPGQVPLKRQVSA